MRDRWKKLKSGRRKMKKKSTMVMSLLSICSLSPYISRRESNIGDTRNCSCRNVDHNTNC